MERRGHWRKADLSHRLVLLAGLLVMVAFLVRGARAGFDASRPDFWAFIAGFVTLFLVGRRSSRRQRRERRLKELEELRRKPVLRIDG